MSSEAGINELTFEKSKEEKKKPFQSLAAQEKKYLIHCKT